MKILTFLILSILSITPLSASYQMKSDIGIPAESKLLNQKISVEGYNLHLSKKETDKKKGLVKRIRKVVKSIKTKISKLLGINIDPGHIVFSILTILNVIGFLFTISVNSPIAVILAIILLLQGIITVLIWLFYTIVKDTINRRSKDISKQKNRKKKRKKTY